MGWMDLYSKLVRAKETKKAVSFESVSLFCGIYYKHKLLLGCCFGKGRSSIRRNDDWFVVNGEALPTDSFTPPRLTLGRLERCKDFTLSMHAVKAGLDGAVAHLCTHVPGEFEENSGVDEELVLLHFQTELPNVYGDSILAANIQIQFELPDELTDAKWDEEGNLLDPWDGDSWIQNLKAADAKEAQRLRRLPIDFPNGYEHGYGPLLIIPNNQETNEVCSFSDLCTALGCLDWK